MSKLKGDNFEQKCIRYIDENREKYNIASKAEILLYKDIDDETKEKYSLTIVDTGIDVVIFNDDKDKSIITIQCKYRSEEDSNLNVNDLDRFISASMAANNVLRMIFMISENIVIRDNSHIGERINMHIKNNHNLIVIKISDSFKSKTVDEQELKKEIILRSYQLKYRTELIKHYITDKKSKGTVIVACGCGKTIMAAIAIKDLVIDTGIIIFVPNIALMKQYENELIDFDIKNNIYHLGNDVNELDIFVDKCVEGKNIPILISTYQSSDKLIDVIKYMGLIIYDEAHHLSEGYCNAFNLVAEKKLFMTATQKIMKMKEGKNEIAVARSMDDEKRFGKIFFKYGFHQAINDKFISDYDIVVPCNDSIIGSTIFHNDFEFLKRAVIKSIEKYKLKKIVVYFNTIKRAKLFENEFRNNSYIDSFITSVEEKEEDISDEFEKKLGDIDSFDLDNYKEKLEEELNRIESFPRLRKTITKFYDRIKIKSENGIECKMIGSEMKRKEREKIMKWFENNDSGVKIISNVNIFAEGVNIPNIDAVLFADIKKSQIDIIQKIGRGLRIFPGKDKLKIILPIFDIDKDKYRPLIEIIANLAEIFVSEKERQSSGKKKRMMDIIKNKVFADGIIEDFDMKIIENLNDYRICEDFETRIKQIINFIEKNGKLPNRSSKNREENLFAQFIADQKKKFNKLDNDKLKLLKTNKLLYNFMISNVNNDKFKERIDEINEFVRKYKKLPKDKSKNRNEKSLGYFITDQKKKFNKLDNDKLKLLKTNKLLYNFMISNVNNDKFKERIDEINEFVRKYKKLPSHHSKNRDEKSLGVFICHQKEKFDKLSDEKIKLIKTIKILYDFMKIKIQQSVKKPFNERINEINKFVKKYKKLPREKSKNKNEKSLGYFINHQKKKFDKLSDEKIKLIKTIKILYDFMKIKQERTIKKSFNERIDEINEFVRKYKKLPSHHSKNRDEKSLGVFICHQKEKFDKLSDEKIKLIKGNKMLYNFMSMSFK